MIKTLAEYQKEAARTLIDKPDSTYSMQQLQLVWCALRVARAAGGLADYVKKSVFHQHPHDHFVLGVHASAIRGAVSDLFVLLHHGIAPHDLPETISDEQIMQLWNVLGLLGESAEVAALVEHDTVLPQLEQIAPKAKELGDVLWYLAALATKNGLTLEQIATINIDKLRKRYSGAGYTAEQSINRVDE